MSGYRVVLSVGGRPVMRGWRRSEATARAKFIRWVGRGGDSARVVLVDETTEAVLDEWPSPL